MTAFFVLVAALLACLPPGAVAQTVDTSDWVCEFCPFRTGHQADFEVGVGSVSDDSAYFDNASGLGEEGVIGIVDGSGGFSSDGQQVEWTLEDLGLDARFAELSGGRQGSYGYLLSYREIPQRKFITTDTIFERSGPGELSLPAGWVRAGSTGGFSALASSLRPRDIESDRSILGIGGRYSARSPFSAFANYRRQQHEGTTILGGASFSTSSLLPVSFDYTTDEVDLGVRYAMQNGFLSLAYYLSDFGSAGNAFSWENPFASIAGAESGQLAQPPDNRFQQLRFAGGFGSRATGSHLSFTAAAGRIDQDALLLPYTTNGSLDTALPRSALNGEVDTTNFAATFTTRAIDNARVKVSYRFDERDNKTPREVWSRVITDSFVSGDSEQNTPYSFQRLTLSMSADYDLLDALRLSGGWGRRTVDREFQEVANQTEDTGWGRIRWRFRQVLDIEARGGIAKRDIDRYSERVAVQMQQNPLLRKYNLAYRYREFAEIDIHASVPNRPVSLTINGFYADDSYSESQLGMVSGDDLRFTADLNWAISDRTSVYLSTGIEEISSEQLGSESFSTADWRANNDDDFLTYGAGLRFLDIGDSIDLHLDYTRSEGTSRIDMVTASGGPSRFPDLETTLDYLYARLAYRRSERLELAATLRYQRFAMDDWSLDDVGPATVPQVLTPGAEAYDDKVLVFGLSFIYRVGNAAGSNRN
ncbi:MAG: MtrB/PioB family decaheme-associated outer membrane protein [Gammaproteobacteria bacterium]|nr:MtrB/PioB family decaheme-associated outer membrane protein [Gammaproteobacteria bacterium]